MQHDFSEGKVSRQIISQAVPLTLAQIVNLMYNIVDRIYLGHLSETDSMALTGVGLIFPIVSLIAAFTSLFGTGGAPLFAIARGAGREERASRLLGHVTSLLTLCSVLLMAVSYLFRRPILFAFGASEASYVYASAYLSIYLIGTPFSMLSTGLNGFINAQGFPRVGMLTTVIGAVINLVLDPLFIFVFGMGVRGAAIATVIGQAVSCLWGLRFLTGKKALIPIRRDHLPVRWGMFKEIVALGIVGFIMQATNALTQVACNTTLQRYGGDLYVSVMTVLNSVREIFSMPIHGITSGAQPVLGYNYGAKKPARVREGIRFTTVIGTLYTLLAWLLVIWQARFLVSIFASDASLLEAGPPALRLYFFGFVFQAFQMCGQTVFQSLGDAKHAVFFSLLRKVVIVTPLTFLLPALGLGVNGVFIAEPVSNFLGGMACFVTMYLTVYKKKLAQAAQ